MQRASPVWSPLSPYHGTCWLQGTKSYSYHLTWPHISHQMAPWLTTSMPRYTKGVFILPFTNSPLIPFLSFTFFILMPNWSFLYSAHLWTLILHFLYYFQKNFISDNLFLFARSFILVERFLNSLAKLLFGWQINYYQKENLNFTNETSTENYNSI